MGSVLSCNECPAANTSSVFTFSEPLVLKITEGVEPEPEPVKEGQPKDLNDREWMEKLLCIDNVHTHAYSLSQEGFNRIVGRIERTLSTLSDQDDCMKRVIQCYQQHKGETIQCVGDVKEFIERIDVKRLKTMKEKYASTQK